MKKSLEVAGREAIYCHYPKTTHWFFENDRARTFHRDAAASAWDRTLAFLQRHREIGYPSTKDSKLQRALKIDRAIYLVDDATKTYRFLQRNPESRSLLPEENEANKKAVDGYKRITRNGETRIYKRTNHP